jgi:hypothetical protein
MKLKIKVTFESYEFYVKHRLIIDEIIELYPPLSKLFLKSQLNKPFLYFIIDKSELKMFRQTLYLFCEKFEIVKYLIF